MAQSSSPILITVRPNQSAYFAGERFKCTIELKNVHQPNHLNLNPFHRTHSRSTSSIFFPNIITPNSSTSAFSSTSSCDSTPSQSVFYSNRSRNYLNQFSSSTLPERKGLIGLNSNSNSPELHKKHHHIRSYSLNQFSTYDQPIRSASHLPGPLGTQLSLSIEEEDHQDDSQTRILPTQMNRQQLSAGPTYGRNNQSGNQWVTIPPIRKVSLQSAPSHRTNFTLPKSLINWAYCQFEGKFELDERLINIKQFENLSKSNLHGGGELKLETSEEGQNKPGWINWIFGNNHNEQNKKLGKKLPVFINPVSLLDIDIHIEPGESKTYSFSIDLPQELPPSFRGRSTKFSYTLNIGTSYDNKTNNRVNGNSNKVFKIPIRVYNHVFMNGARPFYDLHSPIINLRDIAKTNRIREGEKELDLNISKKDQTEKNDESSDLEAYANRLIRKATEVLIDDIEEDELTGGCMTAVEIVTRSSGKVSFDINKDGKPVAQLTLVKSAYRLGEIVEGTLSFNLSGNNNGRVIKASVTLETTELIETSHLLEKDHMTGDQIKLLTSKIHSDYEEFLLNQNRCKFSLVIPTDSTPEFTSSVMKLQWKIKLKFIFLLPSNNNTLTPSSQHTRFHSLSTNDLPKQHYRNKSFANINKLSPKPSTNLVHLLPITGSNEIFKPVPDLSFIPVRYNNSNENVLLPNQIEIVECSIPIKVFPSNTAFRPIISQFFA
ncbi:hypothetical protein CROQUDRAFT_658118 [Cronartium quercuum f. sp. fusiforme G11]|uniref:Rgp1-domain-containing protein n=1 Tax=Cronartium quercuum f. sp. fusiforme G11 TaxID=708437 RepID=A0A9P6TB41_9BASI|nr:hypothetical protein CROQUDRAFT_658118 [Cronartium quercuum f. sp. fusiforme G11]